MTALRQHPDLLFPADSGVRELARRLYAEVADAPIVSPHGHVEARMLLDDEPFADPAALLVTPDHYVTRLLHAHGVELDQLGLARAGGGAPAVGREVWRQLCEHWDAFLGTPVRLWLELELARVFGVEVQPSAANADELYDQLSAQLATDAYRPRALFDRFGIAVLATTDDPAADLSAHLALRDDPTFSGRVVPTFRPDRFLDPSRTGWSTALDELGAVAGVDCGTFAGLIAAFQVRRAAFAAAGGTSTDTGVPDAGCEPLDAATAERLHAAGRAGTIDAAGAVAYRGNLLYRFAELSSEDGLVMQLHPGVLRGHHAPTLAAYGPDTGHDLPEVTAFTRPLTPILRDFGTHPGFRLVLFTVDETTFSRELGPLAGFYPSVYVGSPWWFLDTPDAMLRYRRAVTDSAGFGKTSGFIDDTRAFCSIPARHEVARRVDSGYLASLVAEHRLSEEDAAATARRLVSDIPLDVFRLR